MATLADLARLRPQMAHVTFHGGFASIQRSGLWSVTKLVTEADLPRPQSDALLTTYRTELLRMHLPNGASAVLRDQLRRRKDVEASLSGITEGEWLRLLNDRVFLFPAQHHRVGELVDTYVAKGHVQELVYFDTIKLLSAHEDVIEVATVNTETFPRVKGPTRGRQTFIPLAELPSSHVAKVQEVTVKGWLPVPDDSLRMVLRCFPSGKTEDLWPMVGNYGD